ncbi:MAG: hypothetical protein Q8R86_01900, partial [Sulfuricurvum sp.]|nr:hypothetical protein [Sulfuricurvum sp.]
MKTCLNIAMVTPWPPQNTGIADYAFELAESLSLDGNTIHIITEVENPKKLDNITFITPEEFSKKFDGYDNIIYHLGNNSSFHIYQIYLLKLTGGIVHLHDLVLHYLMAW